MFLKEQNSSSCRQMTVQEVAMGFIEVANETMCRPIRALTQVHVHTQYIYSYIRTYIRN